MARDLVWQIDKQQKRSSAALSAGLSRGVGSGSGGLTQTQPPLLEALPLPYLSWE